MTAQQCTRRGSDPAGLHVVRARSCTENISHRYVTAPLRGGLLTPDNGGYWPRRTGVTDTLPINLFSLNFRIKIANQLRRPPLQMMQRNSSQ